jgi:hypothetical protein
MTRVFIEGTRNGYNPNQCGRTMTVKELIEYLEQFDEDAKIYLKNDNGYTYGSINDYNIEEEYIDEEEEEE